MNVFANILKILIIIVVIAVAGMLLLLGALVLFPGFSIFGLHYIKGAGDPVGNYIELGATAENSKLAEWESASGILIKTVNWDISVAPVTKATENYHLADTLTARWHHEYNGFVFGDVQEPSFSGGTFANVDGKSYLVYEVSEPSGGWLSKVNAKLEILYDAEILEGKDIIIETETGKVQLGNSTSLENRVGFEIEDLTINSAHGEVQIRDVAVNGDVVVSKKTGDLYSYIDLPNNVKIEITDSFGTVDLENVGTAGTSSSLVFEKMGNSNIKVDDVYGDLIFAGNGGLVRANSVSGILSVNGGKCDFDIANVKGDITFESTDGQLKVAEAKGAVNATITGSGGVNIAKSLDVVNVNTKNGAVMLGEACDDVIVKTDGGSINVTGSTDVNTYDISSINGEAVLNNIYGTVKFNALSKGNAKVKVNYCKIVGENIINTQTGVIEVYMPVATSQNINDLKFKLTWETVNDVDIALQGGVSTAEKKGTNVSVNSATDNANTLTLKSVSGKITAKSV